MEFSILIDSDGNNIEVKTISLIEDYWHDYLYFRAQADSMLNRVQS